MNQHDGLSSDIPRSWFEQWREPAEFFTAAEKCNSHFSDREFFRKRANGIDIKYVVEAYGAGEFATTLARTLPCQVALTLEAEEFPDFRLKYDDGTVVGYEHVEADRLGRRRSDEYEAKKGATTTKTTRPPDDYFTSVGQDRLRSEAREAISRGVRRKAKRRYSGGQATGLVVLNNLGLLDPREYRQLTAEWAASFREIWVYRYNMAWRVWPEPMTLCRQ